MKTASALDSDFQSVSSWNFDSQMLTGSLPKLEEEIGFNRMFSSAPVALKEGLVFTLMRQILGDCCPKSAGFMTRLPGRHSFPHLRTKLALSFPAMAKATSSYKGTWRISAAWGTGFSLNWIMTKRFSGTRLPTSNAF